MTNESASEEDKDAATVAMLATRRLDYSYNRKSLTFDVSHALFSSARVDRGTSMLLALIAEAKLPYERVVDLGSGTGTLGISLAAARDVPLSTVDRDGLAGPFTRENARLNQVSLETHVASPFGLSELPEPADARELVVSNLPAKAGEPVLQALGRDMAARAARADGWIGFVLVKPLEHLADSIASALGKTLVRRANANHVAYIVEPHAPDPTMRPVGLDVFTRSEGTFVGPRNGYHAETVYNLPEFDGLAYRTALAFDLLDSAGARGSFLAYGVGQGHLAVGANQVAGTGTIADRDTLSLAIARHNLGEDQETVSSACTPWIHLPNLAGRFRLMIVNDDPVPDSPWADAIIASAQRHLEHDGSLMIVSKSTAVSRFLKAHGTKLAIKRDRKLNGFRALTARLKR